MSKRPEPDHDDLTVWAESHQQTIHPGARILRGEEACAASRALLEAATEDDPEGRELMRRVVIGRPTLDPTKRHTGT
jgi:hypothetical protein